MMRWIDKLRLRLHSLFRRTRVDRDLDRELRFHVDEQIAELMASGMSETEARAAALQSFGRVTHIAQDCRDARGLTLLDDLRHDVHYAARALTRHPGFTTVAIATLALGIGANTAIFSVVYGVLLKPLPYVHAEQLVTLRVTVPPAESRLRSPVRYGNNSSVSVAELTAIQSRTSTLSQLAFTLGPAIMMLQGRGESQRLEGMAVSPRMFEVLGVPPLLGRTFGRDEETPKAAGAIVLAYPTWQRSFAADPHILGQTLLFANSLASPGQGQTKGYTVVGVMPEGFAFANEQVQFWIPSAWNPRADGTLMARLASGVTPEAASTEIDSLFHALRPERPLTTYGLTRVQDTIAEPVRPALRVLTVAVGFVLLIACANLASLLLARGASRQREMAIRIALGAGRARVIRQLLTESLLLALLGGAAGTLLALGGIRLLRTLATTFSRMDLGVDLPFPRLDAIGLDATVLAFTLAASLVAGVLFGIAPALQHARPGQVESLRDGATSAASGFALLRRHRLRGALVVAEIALAMMLLAGGGLLIRSFVKLSRVDPGYDASHVLTFQVALPAGRSDPARLRTFAEDLTAGLEAAPGITAAGYARQLPMVKLRDSFGIATTPTAAAQMPMEAMADSRLVSRDYLRAIGARLIAGREFDEHDGPGQPRALIVNQALARREFGDEQPIGRIVYLGHDDIPWTIVGVVDDVRQFSLDQAPTPQCFSDMRQWPAERNLFPLGPYYVVRTTSGDAGTQVAQIRALAGRLDAESGLFNVATLEAIVSNSTSRPRMYATLLGIFAGVSACLAVIGLYGVMAYAVAQRTREIAIRVALGARRGDVMSLVLRQSLVLIAIGIALGMAGAATVTRYLEAMLFGLTPLDATTFAGAAILFAAVSLIASYVPARRATRVDPLIALRYD